MASLSCPSSWVHSRVSIGKKGYWGPSWHRALCTPQIYSELPGDSEKLSPLPRQQVSGWSGTRLHVWLTLKPVLAAFLLMTAFLCRRLQITVYHQDVASSHVLLNFWASGLSPPKNPGKAPWPPSIPCSAALAQLFVSFLRVADSVQRAWNWISRFPTRRTH